MFQRPTSVAPRHFGLGLIAPACLPVGETRSGNLIGQYNPAIVPRRPHQAPLRTMDGNPPGLTMEDLGFVVSALHLGRAVGASHRPNRDTFRDTAAWPLRYGPLPVACRTGCIGTPNECFGRRLLYGDGPAQVGFGLVRTPPF